MSHYLDNAATTPVRPEAVQAALDELIVHQHHGHQHRVRPQRVPDLLRRDAAPTVRL